MKENLHLLLIKAWYLFLMVLVLGGCSSLPNKRAYINKLRVPKMYNEYIEIPKNFRLNIAKRSIQKYPRVRRVQFTIIPDGYVNRWHRKYEFRIGNKNFNYKIDKYLRYNFLNNREINNLLENNKDYQIEINVNQIELVGHTYRVTWPSIFSVFFLNPREIPDGIKSTISSHIKVSQGEKVVHQTNHVSNYISEGMYSPDISNNFHACLNKHITEIVAYLTQIVNMDEESL